MNNTRHCGVLRKASQEWCQQYGDKPFGLTHRDATPTSWATMFMATQHTQVATKYLVRCMRKDPRFQHKYKRSAAPHVTFVDTAQDTTFPINDKGTPA
eukprot:1351066-Ditylum_brightwellii.AAC.1